MTNRGGPVINRPRARASFGEPVGARHHLVQLQVSLPIEGEPPRKINRRAALLPVQRIDIEPVSLEEFHIKADRLLDPAFEDYPSYPLCV